MDIIDHINKKGWKRVNYTFPGNEEVFQPLVDVEPENLFSININSNAFELMEETEERLVYKGYQLLMAPYGEEGIELLRNKDIELIIEIRHFDQSA